MPRFILVDIELDEIVGDTDRFYARYLRTLAYCQDRELDPLALDKLTPIEAVTVFDLVNGDDGWSYQLSNGACRCGYEIYVAGPFARVVVEAGDPGLVAKARALPLAAVVERITLLA
ncbi:MAG TPA: hypothetical protein VFX37_10615 [Pseudolabrys sp.]|nr:hypothetical protein [Pseudolabrys sp.]